MATAIDASARDRVVGSNLRIFGSRKLVIGDHNIVSGVDILVFGNHNQVCCCSVTRMPSKRYDKMSRSDRACPKIGVWSVQQCPWGLQHGGGKEF